ncbi:WEB family protein [Sesbania bispinosa]|nr:WEB family protein [Sesbania bispinosa]
MPPISSPINPKEEINGNGNENGNGLFKTIKKLDAELEKTKVELKLLMKERKEAVKQRWYWKL